MANTKRKYTPAERLRRMNAYNQAYAKENLFAVAVRLSKKNDTDIIEWINKQENRKASVCKAIREYIANHPEEN